MSFFLLGQGRDTLDLRLISDQVFSSKQEAMGELSRLTADSGFAHWDAEVYVMDLDVGTPVLLVKPAIAEAVTQAEEPTAVVVDEAVVQAEVEEPAEAPESPGPVDEVPTVESESASVWEAPQDTGELETEAANEVEAEIGEPSVDGDSLAQAIKRATGALESEGIVAPESIGPAVQEAPVDSEQAESTPEAPSAAWPWAVEPATPPEVDVAPVAEPDPVAEPEPDAVPEPVAETEAPLEEEPLAAIERELDEEIAPAAVEDSVTSRESQIPEYVPSPFDEPAIDIESDGMVAVPAGMEDSESGRAVILGDYGDTGIAGDLVIEVDPDTAPAPASGGMTVPSGPDIATSTCAECVYVDTCPNKGELDPKSCGSFQWK